MLSAALAAAAVAATASAALPSGLTSVVNRPNLYFGTRTIEEHPLMTGFAWAPAAKTATSPLLHAAFHAQKLQDWGWLVHDGESYGYQFVGDKVSGVNMTFEYAVETREEAAGHAAAGLPGSESCRPWSVLVKGSPATAAGGAKRGARKKRGDGAEALSLFVYLSTGYGEVAVHPPTREGGPTVITGARPAAGGATETFALIVRPGPGNKSPLQVNTHARNVTAAVEAAALKARIKRLNKELKNATDSSVVEELQGGLDAAAVALSAAEARMGVGLPPAGAGPLPATPTGLSPSHPAFLTVQAGPDSTWRVEEMLAEELRLSAAAVDAQLSSARGIARALGGASSTLSSKPAAVPTDFAVTQELELPAVPLLNGTNGQLSIKADFSAELLRAPREGAPPNVAVLQFVVAPSFELEWTFLQGGCTGAAGGLVSVQDADDEDANGQYVAPPPVWEGTAEARGWGTGAATARGPARRALVADALCARLGLCPGVNPSHLRLASHALGNLVGSITYFHGSHVLGFPDADDVRPQVKGLSPPQGLYTGVPSRSFFPRGFLWDEGFHQLIVSQWLPGTTREVVTSWLGSQDPTSGWIPREQILGTEAQSRVPDRFRIQRPDIANPPTLTLPVLIVAVDSLCGSGGDEPSGEMAVGADGAVSAAGSGSVAYTPEQASTVAAFCARHGVGSSAGATVHARGAGAAAIASGSACLYACRGSTSASSPAPVLPPATPERLATLDFVAASYPKLVKLYDWFHATQAGVAAHSFRWRGATQDHCFASGLDDYPRGIVPDEADENVDLLAWMSMFSGILADLAPLAGAPAKQVKRFSGDAATYAARLDAVHWNATAGVYCDVGIHSITPTARNRQGQITSYLKHRGQVCHVGYVSILPLLLRLVDPSSSALPAMLAAMESHAHLGSPYGLRSLAASSPLFASMEDYWRNNVWINMNYLAVAALQHYGRMPGPHAARAAALADTLEAAVVGVVSREYETRGFVFENFDSRSGKGLGTHPFTGWSALTALMVARRYPF